MISENIETISQVTHSAVGGKQSIAQSMQHPNTLSEDLQHRGVTNFSEAVHTAPGVSVGAFGENFNSVQLRGLGSQGRGIPRPRMEVRLGDRTVGRVTSGTFSPTLRKGIALALLDKQAEDGAEVGVDVRGRPEKFVVTRPPFVETGVR